MNRKMPSFVEYVKDVFSTKGFFDTLYDRSKSGLEEKAQKEIGNLYELFQKNPFKTIPLEFTSGSNMSDFAEGATRMVESGKGILPYTKKLFGKYGIPTNGILIQTVKDTTTFKNIQRPEINRKNMADYIHEKALDRYFDVKKVELSHQPIEKIVLGTATFEGKK